MPLSVSRNAATGRDEFTGSMTVAASARTGQVIAPDDDADLAVPCAGLYVGGAGDLVVVLVDDETETDFPDVPAGSILPFAVKKVLETGTTATGIRGLGTA